MSEQADTATLSRLLRPISGQMSDELLRALASARADDEMQRRYDDLAGGNTEGTLTPSERDELASIVRANTVLSVLKSEAKARLESERR